MIGVLRLPDLLFVGAEVAGRRCDVHVRGGRVEALGGRLAVPPGAEVVAAGGGALLPALHDHHIHLLATAAAADSVPCGPPHVTDLVGLRRALAAAPGRRGVRGTGYHESVAGPLDRALLDALVPHRPARVQHRTGALWTLNTPALLALGVTEGDGRLWRTDPRLRPDGGQWPDLARLGRELAELGVLGVSDATPDLDPAVADRIAAAGLPQDVLLLGAPTGWRGSPGVRSGPRKVLLGDEVDLDWSALVATLQAAHAAGRAAAVHTVTRASFVAVLAAFEAAGVLPGDRLEHAAVVPAELLPRVAELGLTVVTQPALAAAHGDDYLRDVDPEDRGDLWPYASLLAAGAAVAPSSDAPFGPLDPWAVLRAARDRLTPAGRVLRAEERVPVATALAGMLAPLAAPGDRARRVRPGAPADLVLLHVPLERALAEPDRALVRLTVAAR